jgi:hypothetical protein
MSPVLQAPFSCDVYLHLLKRHHAVNSITSRPSAPKIRKFEVVPISLRNYPAAPSSLSAITCSSNARVFFVLLRFDDTRVVSPRQRVCRRCAASVSEIASEHN